ncbi:hypothetical protein DPMN_159957 [Dreissena polymorpha]|uniref:Uncharacterized protein n=1 Tax=Dreissena polymorpha TaxID=45954 RepID=A0A9D4INB6_DREPO|nr:hypothetical protein DPMN_159957 [Dreissena polymorpha]
MPEVPVGARLMHFANRWLQITSDAWVHSLVTQGLTFQFEKRPPLSRVPIDLVSPHPQSRTPGKTGGRKGSRPLFSRILQSPFPCSKEKRLLETSHRLKSVQHVSSQTFFQDGDSYLLRRSIRWVLSQSHITAQDFLSLNCILSSVADFVQLGRLFLRPL